MKPFFVFALLPFYFFSQEKNTLRIEFGGDYRNFQMSEFNNQINDTAHIQSDIYTDIQVPVGKHFGAAVSYQPFRFISIGIYGGYQFSAVSRNFIITLDQGNNPFPTTPITGTINYEVNSIHGGLSKNLYLNQMSFWSKYSFLSRIEKSFGINVGFGKATYLSNLEFDDKSIIQNPQKSFYQSQGVQLASFLKMGYIFSNSNYFSSIGLMFGYQSFITSNLKTDNGRTFPYDGNTNLDFSGFCLGIYLSVGR